MIRRFLALGISFAYWVGMRLADGFVRVFFRRRCDECVVLYYHGVSDRQAPRFRRQMAWMAANTTVVPLSRAAETGNGRRTCITFDDGLESVRRNALPILRELRLPATIFVVSSNLGRKPEWPIPALNLEREELLSSAEQLREYPKDLIEIGSHTATHPNMRALSRTESERELSESKRTLENILDRPIASLAIPFGEFTVEALQLAREVGYGAVMTCEPKPVLVGESLIGAGRFKVTPDDWTLEFRLKTVGAYGWRRLLRKLKGDHKKRAALSTSTEEKPPSGVSSERSPQLG